DLLSQRSQEIQSWADQLEDKVAERTDELQRKNRDLQRTIIALRQTRQQLVVAEKLAALGELTAGVAHEINNPTQVMLGNLDLVVSELGDAAIPVQPEIDLVVDQIYRIQEIINNLLQYARPEEYAGYIAEVDVNDVIGETIKLVQHLRKQVKFDLQLTLQSKCIVRISQHELQQVLVNLLVNAIHSLPEIGGVIKLSTEDWEDKGISIAVGDNGAGMDADQLSKIFNPFFTTKNQGKGTGLGLSVSYGLIRRYGGLIRAESTLNEGSRFVVYLLSEPSMIEDDEAIAEQLKQLEDNAVDASSGITI
ncbi:MAG: two-component system NtrC family sensor kinase, partial [Parasphingorhabdus sp.]